MTRCLLLSLLVVCLQLPKIQAAQVLIPMDNTQKNHLKSYGAAYYILQNSVEIDWLLNYRGGSFAFKHSVPLEKELLVRGISYQVLSDAEYNTILTEIASPDANMDVMKLEKVPKIVVYSPKINQPWDDAVTLVLTYAEIPYDRVYDQEILEGKLPTYDWLHLHHEDFTGQYGKSYRHRHEAWFQAQQQESESLAAKYNFTKVSRMKLEVARKIKEFVLGGGYMFAMCSATETFDVALASDGVDIVDEAWDGDGIEPQAQQKIDFTKSFAFENFTLSLGSYNRGFSNIDNKRHERSLYEGNDFFSLFTFSAKWDPVPSMLTQNHEHMIKGFMGQTTAFKKAYVKASAVIMGETKVENEARYIHGTIGKGTWTFYGGHDPEDYWHMPEEESTDLSLHPNSAGYRLILNNILFPAAKKKKQKT
ncbi:asparagine synthetase B [Rhodocytophaga aerolata]|uniref:Asparagine synthetase B n=1 Tax=Rhodocytophaga aerolata TaxID=455078 RepID=A0ABT8R3A3_9BACT|nr:asparagine synthetase B [Rhodocytophaga aerolata]MDO1445763.1 asparagine synthetase B [Rhodocytophaga aerolata]